jgi:hypothetical protein
MLQRFRRDFLWVFGKVSDNYQVVWSRSGNSFHHRFPGWAQPLDKICIWQCNILCIASNVPIGLPGMPEETQETSHFHKRGLFPDSVSGLRHSATSAAPRFGVLVRQCWLHPNTGAERSRTRNYMCFGTMACTERSIPERHCISAHEGKTKYIRMDAINLQITSQATPTRTECSG